MSDDLLARARAGDEQALRLLYEGSRARVLRLAYSLLGDVDEAEDVMQDTLVYALTHLDRYDEDRAAFSTWLHTITVNRCRDRLRHRRTSLRRVAEWLRRADRPVSRESRRGYMAPVDDPIHASSRPHAGGAAVEGDAGDRREPIDLDGLDAADRIGAALRRLTPLQREALVLREIEGLSFQELADVLNVPLRTAQARVTSAHAAMRRALGAAQAGDDGSEAAGHA